MKNKRRSVYSERFREAARKAGLTSEEIARRMGVVGGTVRQWWCGQNEPGMASLQKYAAITGFPIGWFYGEEGKLSEPHRLELWGRVDDLTVRLQYLEDQLGFSIDNPKKKPPE